MGYVWKCELFVVPQVRSMSWFGGRGSGIVLFIQYDGATIVCMGGGRSLEWHPLEAGGRSGVRPFGVVRRTFVRLGPSPFVCGGGRRVSPDLELIGKTDFYRVPGETGGGYFILMCADTIGVLCVVGCLGSGVVYCIWSRQATGICFCMQICRTVCAIAMGGWWAVSLCVGHRWCVVIVCSISRSAISPLLRAIGWMGGGFVGGCRGRGMTTGMCA